MAGGLPSTGLPWTTYKATTSRCGVFRSPTYGAIDFNEDLAGPMYDSLMVAWNKIFKYVRTFLKSAHYNMKSVGNE